MTTELVRGSEAVVNVATGELLHLTDASIEELVQAREALGVLWKQRNEAAAMVDAEIVRRTDAAIAAGELTSYTFEIGGQRVAVDTGRSPVYDGNGLRAEVLAMHQRGELDERISRHAIEQAFVVRNYYVRLSNWRNLRGLDPKLAALDSRFTTPPKRAVKVEPLPAHRRVIEGTAEEVLS